MIFALAVVIYALAVVIFALAVVIFGLAVVIFALAVEISFPWNNCIGGVMVSVLASSAVDRGFEQNGNENWC
jgi:hypothetical protein